jgi:hypothetical protein
MTGRFSRGVALVETALSVGVALIIVLGAAQMALIGYTQVSADGAAFIAAHTRAANPGANGATTATGVFSQFSPGNFSSPSPSPLLDPAVVTTSVGGFSLVPGVASTYSVTGKDVEYAPANASSTPAPFAFSINATLLNDCQPTGTCALPSNTAIYLAQQMGNNNGNGVNGQFGEWRCHQRHFANLAHAFSGGYPAMTGYGSIKGSNLDVKQPNSDENAVYSWDSGNHKCV